MPTSSGFQISEVLTAQNTNTYLLRPYTNCLMNGAMNIAQRATSATGVTSFAYYTVDRWFHSLSGAGTWTDTVQSLTASDAPVGEGIRNSWKTTCTTANASLASNAFHGLVQAMEGFNVQQFAKGTASAKPFALSFWVRTNRTGTYIAELIDGDNNRTCSASYTITSSNVWQKVRLIFPADVTGLFDNDNNNSLALFMWLGAGSDFSAGTLQSVWATTVQNKRASGQVNVAGAVNNFFEVTGLQLEPNSVCTPFENRLYGTELALCQRYFYKITGTGQYEPVASAGINNSPTTHWRTTTSLPVAMRRALTTADMAFQYLAAYDGAGIVNVTAGAIVGHTVNSSMLSIDWGSAGSLTTGRPVVVLVNPYGAIAYFQVSADL